MTFHKTFQFYSSTSGTTVITLECFFRIQLQMKHYSSLMIVIWKILNNFCQFTRNRNWSFILAHDSIFNIQKVIIGIVTSNIFANNPFIFAWSMVWIQQFKSFHAGCSHRMIAIQAQAQCSVVESCGCPLIFCQHKSYKVVFTVFKENSTLINEKTIMCYMV